MADFFQKSAIFLFLSCPLHSASSFSLVITTVYPLSSSNFFALMAMARLISFSFVPATPTFPGSNPPCPGSRTTVAFVPAAVRFSVDKSASPQPVRNTRKRAATAHKATMAAICFFLLPSFISNCYFPCEIFDSIYAS